MAVSGCAKGIARVGLDRRRNRFNYGPDSDLATFAAHTGFGIATNHSLSTATTALRSNGTFLGINGLTITAEEPEVVPLIFRRAGRRTE
jgi:prophage maintenance system killer protein